jgi:hypothetical protein
MTALLTHNPVARGHQAAVLSEVLWPQVHLALWQRPRPASLDWLDAHDWDMVDDVDAVLEEGDWGTAAADLLLAAGYPWTPAGLALVDEIADLARRFALLMACAALRLRLEVVETDACRKFHTDQLCARLLCTLSGPGTQWIETGADPQVMQMAPGEVAIFKGRLWAEEPAILHRSPPIAVSGERRLLLVLDPVWEAGSASG